jgi:hypothetical protein
VIKKYFAASVLIVVSSVAWAQSPPAGQQQQTPPPGQETSSGQAEPPPPESGGSSLVEDILDSTGNRLGFSFSSFEMYTTNGLKGPQGSDLAMGVVYPQIFTNRRGKRSTLHLDYGIGYRVYHGKKELNTFSQTGYASWEARLARYTNFQLSDTFSSSPNDYGFSLGGRVPQTEFQPIYSQEILVDRQRMLTNSVAISLSQRITKRIKAAVFGSYDYLRYSRDSFRDVQGYQVGVRGDIQINKWLYLDNSYSTYLNTIDGKLRASNIHRLQVGGLRFQLSRRTQFFTTGALEYTGYQGEGHTTAGIESGISRTTKSNSLQISYHRGLSTTLGPGAILQGHNATLSFSQRFGSRFTFQMDGSYLRGKGFTADSMMESISGYGGLQIGLQRNLVATTNIGFVSQRISNLPIVAPDLRRYTAYAGLQYFLPTLRGR